MGFVRCSVLMGELGKLITSFMWPFFLIAIFRVTPDNRKSNWVCRTHFVVQGQFIQVWNHLSDWFVLLLQHFQDGRRAQQHIESSWKQLESVSDRSDHTFWPHPPVYWLCLKSTPTHPSTILTLPTNSSASYSKEKFTVWRLKLISSYLSFCSFFSFSFLE